MTEDSVITTTSWEDGVEKLKELMKKEQSDITIYSTERLVPEMYKSDPYVHIIMYSNNANRSYKFSNYISLLRSMLTTWYDLHEELEQEICDDDEYDDQYDCNSRPLIQYFDKAAAGDRIFNLIIQSHKKDLKYPIYKDGKWHI